MQIAPRLAVLSLSVRKLVSYRPLAQRRGLGLCVRFHGSKARCSNRMDRKWRNCGANLTPHLKKALLHGETRQAKRHEARPRIGGNGCGVRRAGPQQRPVQEISRLDALTLSWSPGCRSSGSRALARRRRLRRPTRCVAVNLRPPLGWLRIKSACEKTIQACQRVLCSDVVEAANLAIPPPARRSGGAGPARERVAPDAVDAAATRRDW